MWAGIVGGSVIGPVFLPVNLNGANCLRFLTEDLNDVLMVLQVSRYVRLVMDNRVTFQHDAAPAHFARDVRAHLNERFPQWIGRGGPVPWPARFPDLKPLDFFMGPLKKHCLCGAV